MENIIKEKYIPQSTSPIPIEGIEKILFQMKSCICKIFNKNTGQTGTGFFCKIPFPNKLNLLPVLITNNHVLNQNDIETGKIIDININNNNEHKKIKIDNIRKKITSDEEELDLTIIEIKINEDKIYNFLEIDENKFSDINIKEDNFRNKSAYILHYPLNENIQASFGLINRLKDKNFIHFCSTDHGSSGSPILSLDTFKVIGIHHGSDSIKNYNYALFIPYAINEFNNKYKNQINIEEKYEKLLENNIQEKEKEINNIVIDNKNINNEKNNDDKIQLFSDKFVINQNNSFLIINGKKCEFSKYINKNQIKQVDKIDSIYKYSYKNQGNYMIYNVVSLLYYSELSDFSPLSFIKNNFNIINKAKEIKLGEEKVYKLSYLKAHQLYAMGLNKKINFYDTDFNLKMTTNILDDIVSCIYELKNGKILVTDYSKTVKILEIKDKEVKIYSNLESENQKNFIGIELSKGKIICGGTKYLTLIEHSRSRYLIKNIKCFNSFIKHIIELNAEEFLFTVGRSLIFKNINYFDFIDVIHLESRIDSISKISTDFIAIAGKEENINTASIYIISLKKRLIYNKFYINAFNYSNFVLSLNYNVFIAVGGNMETRNNDFMIMEYFETRNKIIVHSHYKKMHDDLLEDIIFNGNSIISIDKSNYLKIWNYNSN